MRTRSGATGDVGIMVLFGIMILLTIPMVAEAGDAQSYSFDIDRTGSIEFMSPWLVQAASSTNVEETNDGSLTLIKTAQDGTYTSVIYNRTSSSVSLDVLEWSSVVNGDNIQATVEYSNNYSMSNPSSATTVLGSGSGMYRFNVNETAEHYRLVLDMTGGEGEVSIESARIVLDQSPISVRAPDRVFEIMGVATVVLALALLAARMG